MGLRKYPPLYYNTACKTGYAPILRALRSPFSFSGSAALHGILGVLLVLLL